MQCAESLSGASLRLVNEPAESDACARHEQWAVPLVRLDLAPGWNAIGDLEVIDDPPIVELVADALPARTKQNQVVVVATREQAVAMRERSLKAGFARIVYRGEEGKLWDPFPPGDWVDRA